MNDLSSDSGRLARLLVRRRGQGALASRLARAGLEGAPYASLVTYATDWQGQPLFLLSDLADHSKNLAADAAASLLVESGGEHPEPLTQPRVTLVGRMEKLADPALKARFLARHPGASVYAGFEDFQLYRLKVAEAHLVAGFGRIHWLSAEQLLCPGEGSDAELSAIDPALRQADGDGGWRLAKGRLERFDFPTPVGDQAAWQAAYAALQKGYPKDPQS